MKNLISGILFICMIAVAAVSGYAQDSEVPKAKKLENHSWHQVVMIKFKPGTMSDAKKIIKDHFMKAGITSKLPGPQMMDFKTGEWDMMMVWTMNGIEDMDWEITPDDEKWWAAMIKQEGSMDKAMAVMKKYLGMVERSTSYLAISENMIPGNAMGSND